MTETVVSAVGSAPQSTAKRPGTARGRSSDVNSTNGLVQLSAAPATPLTPRALFRQRSTETAEAHTMAGASPADVSPRFGDSAVDIRLVEVATRPVPVVTPTIPTILCGRCHNPIPEGRVEAIMRDGYGPPKLCVGCQTNEEKSHHPYATRRR